MGLLWSWGSVEDKCPRETEDGKGVRPGEKKLLGPES